MFLYSQCKYPGCTIPAITTISEDGEKIIPSSYCFVHSQNKAEEQEKIYDYIRRHDKIIGLNASGFTFENIDFSGKRFYGCSFAYCHFNGLSSTGMRSRISTFEFSVFSDCNLIESNMQFTSFAGAKMSHVLFTGSDMIQNNFCGLSAFQSSFDDSDLYNSCFIKAKLIDTSFRNCNIKETKFFDITQQNVSFRQSNTNAAIFDIRGSALFTGLEELDVPRGETKGPSL